MSIEKITEKLENILVQNFGFCIREKGALTKILVAVSGGSDSIFLLFMLYFLKQKFNFEIFAVHINHNLRGKESEADEAFVKNFCKNLKIKCFVEETYFESKTGIEEKARNFRYKIFEKICVENKIEFCFLAHNADDDVETVLMNILRGTGLSGLSGIPESRFLDARKRVQIVRPLLTFFKSDIERFLVQNKIKFRLDSSNLSKKFTRNKFRLDLIPSLEKYNKNFKQNILNLKNIALSSDFFINFSIAKNFSKCFILSKNTEIALNLDEYFKYERLVRLNILAFFARGKADFKHLSKLFELIEGRKNFKFHLKSNHFVTRQNKVLKLEKKGNVEDKEQINLKKFNELLKNKKSGKIDDFFLEIEIFDVSLLKKNEICTNKNCIFLDFELVKSENLNFRFRKAGDKFKPLGMQNYKKLNRFFIDEKIDVAKRNDFLLLSTEKEIVWVVGVRTSETFKVSDTTRKVMKICVEIKNKIFVC